jgi:hypothetical protein
MPAVLFFVRAVSRVEASLLMETFSPEWIWYVCEAEEARLKIVRTRRVCGQKPLHCSILLPCVYTSRVG